jgi:GNAT superfamily N-acetyltransferase
MEAHQQPDYRVGKPPDAAALASVVFDAVATYFDWNPPGWRPGVALDKREAQRVSERLGEPGYWCLIAEAGGQAIGYTIMRPGVEREEPHEPIPGLAHIWHLFVRPAWWGTDVAATLLRSAVAEAGRQGYERMRLWTPRDNGRARAFYRREGFRETGAERYAEDVALHLVEYRRPVILGP